MGGGRLMLSEGRDTYTWKMKNKRSTTKVSVSTAHRTIPHSFEFMRWHNNTSGTIGARIWHSANFKWLWPGPLPRISYFDLFVCFSFCPSFNFGNFDSLRFIFFAHFLDWLSRVSFEFDVKILEKKDDDLQWIESNLFVYWNLTDRMEQNGLKRIFFLCWRDQINSHKFYTLQIHSHLFSCSERVCGCERVSEGRVWKWKIQQTFEPRIIDKMCASTITLCPVRWLSNDIDALR